MTSMHFIGLDIHKKTISYCVKDVSGTVLSEGTIAATRAQLDDWVKTLPARGPWPWKKPCLPDGSMTNFCLSVLHPLMLRAIGAGQEEERSHRCQQDLRLSSM